MALSSDQQLDINEIRRYPLGSFERQNRESNYLRKYGETYIQTVAREDVTQAANIQAISAIYTDPVPLNLGSAVFNVQEATRATTNMGDNILNGPITFSNTPRPSTTTTSRNADLIGGSSVITGAPTIIPRLTEVPNTPVLPIAPTVTINNDPICDYRYSFGCPEFSRIPNEMGCRILIPIYRTCYTVSNVLSASLTNRSSFALKPELYGYFDITQLAGQTINETTNEPGGVRRKIGIQLTPDSLRNALQGQNNASLVSLKRAKVYRPSTAGGQTVYTTNPNETESPLDVVFRNLEVPGVSQNNASVSSSTGAPPIGLLSSVVDDLIRRCDFRNQPAYCITTNTFTPVTPPPPPQPVGPFEGDGPIPTGKRTIIGDRARRVYEPEDPSTRQKHPSKPCVSAIPVPFQEFQDIAVEFGIPLYGNANRSGTPISYKGITTVTESRLIRSDVEYRKELPDTENCFYREIIKEYMEDDPNDKCFGIIKKDVTRVYENGRTELYLQGAFVSYYRKQDADCSPETVKIYHPLNLGKDLITGKTRAKTKGLFDGSQTLECHHTSSTQPTASKTHYYEVTDCDSCGKTPYFAVAYGHNQGSGSTWAEGELFDTATRAVYSQYRLIALEMPEKEFTFYTNGVPTSSKDAYIINFSRVGMSDRIDPGNWELPLAELRGKAYANNVFTGSNVAVSSSNKVLTFIDDSDDRSDTISCTHDPYVSYDIISGSLDNGAYATSSRHTYGIMYPNLGIMVLDPYKLNTELGFNTVTGSNIAGDNSFKIFTSISGSGVLGSYMKARNVHYKTTNHYFVRIAAPFANYSNNPTWVSGSNGQLFHPCFEQNPQTYITTVGLYDDFNQLLAVAKLSKPINKSFDNDVLIKIRLNW